LKLLIHKNVCGKVKKKPEYLTVYCKMALWFFANVFVFTPTSMHHQLHSSVLLSSHLIYK